MTETVARCPDCGAIDAAWSGDHRQDCPAASATTDGDAARPALLA